jgi:DNA invertase Pin-like site-specific DNA recombinase
MVAIGYVRVSTEQQADGGISLEAQAHKVRAMATVQGAELLDVVVDAGESAKSLQRPGMARILRLVDAGAIDTVIIAKLDRLTRSVADLAELLKRFEKRAVSLVSVADSLDTRSAAGRLVLNIMVSVSQWEREAIGERTKDALDHKRRDGMRIGTIPYGWALGPDRSSLVLAQCEQAVIAEISAMAADGASTRKIAADLNSQGYTTRSGSPWRFQYVSRVLQSANRATTRGLREPGGGCITVSPAQDSGGSAGCRSRRRSARTDLNF